MKPNREDSERRQARAANALFEATVCLETAEEARAFLMDLCTPAELQALIDRWQVVAYLEQGLPYRQIHDLTGVSVTTIGRVARFLTQGFGGYETVLRRLDAGPMPAGASEQQRTNATADQHREDQ